MKIKCQNKELEGLNATVRMESGDHLSVAFTDLQGVSRIITLSVQGKVMLVNDTKTDDSLIMRNAENYFLKGD